MTIKTLVAAVLCAMLSLGFAAEPAIASSQQDIAIDAGDARLTGKLYMPTSKRAVPAVILVAGSQASRNLPGIADHLAGSGIAVLSLNKRGVNGSAGSWNDETIDRRANDVLAAVRYLKTVKGVDANRIGLAGHSQGGWVVQAAAAKSNDVKFLILLGGPAQSIREQVLTDERIHLTRWGVPEAEVKTRIEQFDQLLTAALSNPMVCGDQPHHYLCGLIAFDPADSLSKVRVPILALYGERDPMTPPEPNLELLLHKLPESTRPLVTSKVFPGANHLFWRSETGLRDEYDRLKPGYVDGFLDTISQWVRQVSASAVPPTR